MSGSRRGPTLLLTLLALLTLAPVLSACVDAGPELGVTAEALRTSTEPDPGLTPGEQCSPDDPHFDGYRYADQIAHCRRSVSRGRKADVYDAYGVPDHERTAYEIDHRISLSLGGDNSFENLWPLYKPEARRKARVEQQLHLDLRDGRIDQAEAIDTILSWR